METAIRLSLFTVFMGIGMIVASDIANTVASPRHLLVIGFWIQFMGFTVMIGTIPTSRSTPWPFDIAIVMTGCGVGFSLKTLVVMNERLTKAKKLLGKLYSPSQ